MKKQFDIEAYMKRIQEQDAKKPKKDPNYWPCDGCGKLIHQDDLKFVEIRNGCGWQGCSECRAKEKEAEA